jgi:hypothetical protein
LTLNVILPVIDFRRSGLLLRKLVNRAYAADRNCLIWSAKSRAAIGAVESWVHDKH